MAERPIPEMVGATTQPVTLTGDVAHSQVPVKPPSGPAREARAAAAAPQKVYLNLENITGSGKPERYSVYLNLPQDADAARHPELHAGDLPMFGVVESSTADENHSGSGLHYSLDVTDVVHSLEAKGEWNPANLRVSFVPKRKGRATHRIEVGRVSLYYA
jgi:tyrosinase